QSKSGTAPFTYTVSIPFDSSVTTGNAIVVGVERASGPVSGNVSVTDNHGNIYSMADASGLHGVWVASNVVGGATTVTVTGSGGAIGATVNEYSGLAIN